MPMDPALLGPVDKAEVFAREGLDPSIPLISISTGSLGSGNPDKIARNIDQAATGPVQLVIATASNKKLLKNSKGSKRRET